MDCLQANCTSSEVTAALGLQSSNCAAASMAPFFFELPESLT